jgi:hypothetical protein
MGATITELRRTVIIVSSFANDSKPLLHVRQEYKNGPDRSLLLLLLSALIFSINIGIRLERQKSQHTITLNWQERLALNGSSSPSFGLTSHWIHYQR